MLFISTPFLLVKCSCNPIRQNFWKHNCTVAKSLRVMVQNMKIIISIILSQMNVFRFFSQSQHDIHRCFSLHLAHGQIHQTHFSDHDHFLPFFLHPPLLPFFFLYPPPPCGEVGTKEANMAASFSACSISSFSFLTRCISWHIILCSVQAAL